MLENEVLHLFSERILQLMCFLDILGRPVKGWDKYS